ncbi:hypothetical protein ERC79_10520 [Rhodococcus sp. ABRD24]|uniref:hypothetical protein n=1 Tax=Rhodococcus sp. ABRD24 TaxID=2507582 RepID=UPI00103B3C8C|nr:hypothetical protein [Rhodococcus sp. ABRD24]QBJ96351.1 hypothetical protein ERC79_10520 [Rhodococcus sp. ABRD24]
MEDAVLAMIFLAGAGMCALAAYTGAQGWVTDPAKGYKVPSKVRASPELTGVANTLVARWCTVASVLYLIPAAALVPSVFSEFQIPLPTWKLVALAAYGMVVSMVAAYPFERISRL